MQNDDLRTLGLGLKENGNVELDASVLKGLKKMPMAVMAFMALNFGKDILWAFCGCL